MQQQDAEPLDAEATLRLHNQLMEQVRLPRPPHPHR